MMRNTESGRRLHPIWGGLAALAIALPSWAQSSDSAEMAAAQPVAETSLDSTLAANDAIGTRFYIAPMMNFVYADQSRATDDAYGASLAFGKKLTNFLALELGGYYNRYTTDSHDGNGGAQLYGGGLAALVSPFPGLRDLYGVFSAEYGRTRDLPGTTQDYDSVLYGAGLGYLYQITDGGTALRSEVLYRVDTHDSDDAAGHKNFDEVLVRVGLMFPLGGDKPETTSSVEAAGVVPIADDDNDGVANDSDQCPNTPPGAIVNAQGCENDEDGDGVVDRLDRCPNTPPGTAVNAEGCPLQAPKPACRPPSPGEAITLEGCGAGDTIVLQGVTFEFNEARLTANARAILDGVADALIARGDIQVEIGGHTDSRGSDDYNQKLSERRAQSVMQYLVGKGIASDRLSAKGYGETQPVSDNNSDEGRELNRRVELKIVG